VAVGAENNTKDNFGFDTPSYTFFFLLTVTFIPCSLMTALALSADFGPNTKSLPTPVKFFFFWKLAAYTNFHLSLLEGEIGCDFKIKQPRFF
jgi:hypothetical protein